VAEAGLSWPLPDELTDAVLEEKLYGEAGTKQGSRRHAEPDWALINRELKRKHVTLSILWEEYIAQHPAGYRYSRFCDLYRHWEGKLSLTMRQSRAGGDGTPLLATHLCRRHPRPSRPQRPAHRSRRRFLAAKATSKTTPAAAP
jgi:transposase